MCWRHSKPKSVGKSVQHYNTKRAKLMELYGSGEITGQGRSKWEISTLIKENKQ